MLWTRPLGLGHSSIVVDEGRLYTMYRPGKQISKQGPWENEEVVISMDGATGKTLWEHRYPSEPADFSYGVGPHATPLVVGRLVFTAGTRKVIHAFDKSTGRVVWSHDLVKEYGATPLLVRAPIKSGYAVSPLAYKDTIIVPAGGRGQAVMAFRQSDGASCGRPAIFYRRSLAHSHRRQRSDAACRVRRPDRERPRPRHGALLVASAQHRMDMNNSTPGWGADNILFISSAYNQGARGCASRSAAGKR